MLAEKYNQLITDGFCIHENILSEIMLGRLREVTDRLLDGMDEFDTKRYRSQGSMIHTNTDPIFVELIACEPALGALLSMGFEDPTFTNGYIISKPPQSPQLFWHYDWFYWEDPISFDPRPREVFLMYYLTDTTRHNGCMRAIPGSHIYHNPLHAIIDAPHSDELASAEQMDRPEFSARPDEVDIPVRAGDLLIGDARLLHATHPNKSDTNRTVLTLWMQPDYAKLPERIKARMVEKTHIIPENWPANVKEMYQRLTPKYDGDAAPYPETLYRRNLSDKSHNPA